MSDEINRLLGGKAIEELKQIMAEERAKRKMLPQSSGWVQVNENTRQKVTFGRNSIKFNTQTRITRGGGNGGPDAKDSK